MDHITEKIIQALGSAGKSLCASEIAEAIDDKSACDIDRQRLKMIYQALLRLTDEGRLDFDPDDPLCFRLKKGKGRS